MSTFKQRWTNLNAGQKIHLAQGLDVNKGYLSRVAHGAGEPSLILARCLAGDLETTVEALFPNVFSDLLPSIPKSVTPPLAVFISSKANINTAQKLNHR